MLWVLQRLEPRLLALRLRPEPRELPSLA